ncbi:RecQ family ATP-dependent DNA helicase [Mycobacterium sp. CPCC 205372]|uniref:ATP-dependent DNA helicase RecQ n=1 Tax=Mycobacterium hippophais TaxID=3016340 RepID=A0ABT4PW85_9MYCO|nr:RecQ family ATP-dependent DNA helicase [Mycobacterium hippophais]MCZ8380739.1 RecQ family ATP-dependent DNA helicase [Mycobacterium hippophais]
MAQHRTETRDDLAAVAQREFGWSRLRPEQLEAMEALLAGRDLVAVMPTGWGKSAIYQVPALLLEHATVVVSPLIALQHDQIAALDGTAAVAVAVHSGQRANERRRAWDAIGRGRADVIFVSPEQLANDDVVARLADAVVSLIVVDEAHCVSAWGHDFRPDYLRLSDVFGRLGRGVPVAALTATASTVVRREISAGLGLRDPVSVIGGFDRPNLRLQVEQHLDDDGKRAAVCERVPTLGRPGLLYAATRKDAEFYADALAGRGMRTAVYHAGLSAAQRDEVHAGFRDDRFDVVTATSAFGMGIDKANVRFVVHASVPESLDSYYQQIGRGGRDGDEATALLYYRPEDLGLARFFTTHTPDEQTIAEVYRALDDDEPRRLKELRANLDLRGRALTNAVNLLEQAGAVLSTRRGLTAAGVDPATAVKQARHVIETRERIDRSRVEMMRGYAETRDCRRRFLLAYFGEALPAPCGNCDRCLDADHPPTGSADAAAVPVDTAVRHREFGDGVVIGAEQDRITVLFDEYGYRTLAMAAIEDSDLLTRL